MGRAVSTVLAASAGNNMLRAAFEYLCAHANAEKQLAENPSLRARAYRAA